MIEVINFTKRYGDFVAVDDLSFSIGKGEIFGFIGPNGAGKSTTIRFLATLLRPTSGEGRIAGHSVTADPMAVRRVIGFMPDDFGVYDGMKVWEFLDFFAVAYEIPRTSRKKIIGEVLELLDLTHKRDDYVNGLSKGMKQRLCLAKTLVHDPPVLDPRRAGLGPRPPGPAGDEGAAERAAADGQDDPRSPATSSRSWPTSAPRSASSSGASCWRPAASRRSSSRSARTGCSRSALLDEDTDRAAAHPPRRSRRSAWSRPTTTP